MKKILFESIGLKGQEMLAKSFVVIVGCGGLGSIIANNMVRSGIGKIRIVDKDTVELSNLQRQLLFDEEDVDKKIYKGLAAREKLLKINSGTEIEAIVDALNEENLKKYLSGADLILGVTDNFRTRFLINEFCIKNKILWIYGAVAGSSGMVYKIIPGKNICFKCIFREEPA